MPAHVREEVPGACIKGAEERVRERSLVSGAVSALLVGVEGTGLVASPRIQCSLGHSTAQSLS